MLIVLIHRASQPLLYIITQGCRRNHLDIGSEPDNFTYQFSWVSVGSLQQIAAMHRPSRIHTIWRRIADIGSNEENLLIRDPRFQACFSISGSTSILTLPARLNILGFRTLASV